MQKSKEYCWICDDRGFTYETNPYDPEDIVKEICECQSEKELDNEAKKLLKMFEEGLDNELL